MEFPEGFDPTRCVLFLGSGFSASAKNKRRKHPPVGNGLRDQILEEVGSDPEGVDLKDAARFASGKGLDLHGMLHNLFTITELCDDQRTVLSKKWRRIYTTNYDDSVEFFEASSGRKPSRDSYSIEDVRPRKFAADSVVHLHGYIHSCSKQHVLSQLILDHRSYAEQAALHSAWWDQFERDIQGAQWVFVIGYNLNDFKVASYFTKNPQIAQKTRFILRSGVNEILADRLAGYGAVDEIALAGFASACSTVADSDPVSEFRQLNAFELIDPYKDNKSVVTPTPVELEAFLTRGNYNFQSLSSTYPKLEFAFPRTQQMDEAREAVLEARTTILHSRVANGKSVFADMLSLDLSSLGKRCVRYKSHSDIPPAELEYLSQFQDLVVFVRTYDDIVEIANDLKGLHRNCKIVVEINTGTDQVRRSEVQSSLEGPIRRIDLNPFSSDDRKDLSKLLSHAGFPTGAIDLRGEGRTELRDHLIEILNSPHVKKRLDNALKSLLADRSAMRVVTTACVLRAFSIHAGLDFIRAVTGEDPFDALLKNEVAASEFGSFSPEELALHSATFGEFFLKQYVGGEGIVSVVCRLAFEAARRKSGGDHPQSQRSREARKALGVLVQYTKVSNLLNGTPDAEKRIGELYERLRENVYINNEPLFWLQYSIFMQNASNYPMARNHLETAYERATLIESFRTFQLDTNYLRLILQAPRGEHGYPGDTEILFDLVDKVGKMVTSVDHRVHAFRVLEDLKLFSMNHGESLTRGERQRLSIQCLRLARDFENLGTEVKIEFETNRVKSSIEETIALLASYT